MMFEDFDSVEKLFAKLVNKGKPVAIYTRPNYSYHSIAALVPEGFKWERLVEHYYDPVEEALFQSSVQEAFLYNSSVFHGHQEGERCTNDKYCHVIGYRPTGKEKPSFIEGFYRKWPQYRSSNSSSISSNDGLGDVLFEGF